MSIGISECAFPQYIANNALQTYAYNSLNDVIFKDFKSLSAVKERN